MLRVIRLSSFFVIQVFSGTREFYISSSVGTFEDRFSMSKESKPSLFVQGNFCQIVHQMYIVFTLKHSVAGCTVEVIQIVVWLVYIAHFSVDNVSDGGISFMYFWQAVHTGEKWVTIHVFPFSVLWIESTQLLITLLISFYKVLVLLQFMAENL